jgi:hypothetical protein
MIDIIAITEYRREDYPRMLELAPDGGGMEKTYEEWKELCDAGVIAVASQGVRIVRILVDPEEFAAWLRMRKLKSTPESRSRYAVEMANKRFGTH